MSFYQHALLGYCVFVCACIYMSLSDWLLNCLSAFSSASTLIHYGETKSPWGIPYIPTYHCYFPGLCTHLHVCSTASHHRMHYHVWHTCVPCIDRHTYCYVKLTLGSKGGGFNLETIKDPIWGGLALFGKGMTRMLLFFLKEGYLWPTFRSGRTRWDWAWPSRPTPTTTALWWVPL